MSGPLGICMNSPLDRRTDDIQSVILLLEFFLRNYTHTKYCVNYVVLSSNNRKSVCMSDYLEEINNSWS